MKSILILILVLIFNSGAIYSQCNENTQTTDWQRFNANNYPNSLVNFDWTKTGNSYPFYLQDNMDARYPSGNLELPYFCSKPPGSGNCGDNTIKYELLGNNAENQDILPSQGWELLVYSFGTPNSSLTEKDGKGQINPFFVLYNRNSGKLKMYIAVTGQQSATYGSLRIEFSSSGLITKRSLFMFAESIVKPLDGFDNSLKVRTFNNYVTKNFNNDYQWFVGELQTGYDPCTCEDFNAEPYSTYTLVSITPQLINLTNLEETIEGTTKQQINGSGFNLSSNQTIAVGDKVLNGASAAIAGFTKYNGYKNEAISFIDKQHTTYQDKLIKEWWKEMDINGYVAGAVSTAQKKVMFDDFKNSDNNFKKLMGIKEIDKYSKLAGTLKGIASAAPYVGAAIGIYDFLSTMNDPAKQVEQSPPLSYFTSLKLKGSAIVETGKQGFTFILPGQRNSYSSSAGLIPHYNNVLGVFNILKTPNWEYGNINPTKVLLNANQYDKSKIDEFLKTHPDYKIILNQKYNHTNDQNQWAALESNILREFKLSEDLKYVVNPTSRMEVESIDAAFVLEYSSSDLFYTGLPSDYSNLKPFPYYQYFSDNNKTISERIDNWAKYGIELEYISNNFETSNTGKLRLRTRYVPLQCLKDLSFVMFGGGKVGPIYVKLIIKLKNTSTIGYKYLTQIITYDLLDLINNATNSNNSGNYFLGLEHNSNMSTAEFISKNIDKKTADFSLTYRHIKYKYNNSFVYINNTAFLKNIFYQGTRIINGITERYISGDYTIDDNLFLENSVTYVLGKVFILSNAKISGSNFKIVSTDGFTIEPNSIIEPNIELIVEKDLVNNYMGCGINSPNISALHASYTEIKDLCASTKYKNKATASEPKPIIEAKRQSNDEFCSLIPNPSNSSTKIVINSKEISTYTISLTDILGKVISISRVETAQGKGTCEIKTADLVNGIYFLIVESGSEKTTKKLLVQH